MKLLFDQNLSRKLVKLLAEDYPDSRHVLFVDIDTHADDNIYYFARREGFIVVSMDKDFADLSKQRGAPPKVIWLLCGNALTEHVAEILRKAKRDIEKLVNSQEVDLLELF